MDLVGACAPSCKTKTDSQKVKVFTYYVPIKGKPQDDEIALIEIWKKSWALRGWTPVVLGEEHVPDDPAARKLEPREVGAMTVYERHVPCLVSGTREEFMRICHLFADYRADSADRVGWQKDTSDMKILIRCPEAYIQKRDCVEYCLPEWDDASAVHFSNFAMKPRGCMPRYSCIESLRSFA